MNAEEIEIGGGNVYADLGFPDAEAMLVKAKLALAISTAIERSGLNQTEAAKRLGISQPKLSNLLAGKFSGISERKMMDCLVKLDNEIEIRIQPQKTGSAASINVRYVTPRKTAKKKVTRPSRSHPKDRAGNAGSGRAPVRAATR